MYRQRNEPKKASPGDAGPSFARAPLRAGAGSGSGRQALHGLTAGWAASLRLALRAAPLSTSGSRSFAPGERSRWRQGGTQDCRPHRERTTQSPAGSATWFLPPSGSPSIAGATGTARRGVPTDGRTRTVSTRMCCLRGPVAPATRIGALFEPIRLGEGRARPGCASFGSFSCAPRKGTRPPSGGRNPTAIPESTC